MRDPFERFDPSSKKKFEFKKFMKKKKVRMKKNSKPLIEKKIDISQ